MKKQDEAKRVKDADDVDTQLLHKSSMFSSQLSPIFLCSNSFHSHSLGLRSPGHQGELSIVITLRIPSEMCSPASCFHNSRDEVEKLVISTSCTPSLVTGVLLG